MSEVQGNISSALDVERLRSVARQIRMIASGCSDVVVTLRLGALADELEKTVRQKTGARRF